jgi:hypothetical protein
MPAPFSSICRGPACLSIGVAPRRRAQFGRALISLSSSTVSLRAATTKAMFAVCGQTKPQTDNPLEAIRADLLGVEDDVNDAISLMGAGDAADVDGRIDRWLDEIGEFNEVRHERSPSSPF